MLRIFITLSCFLMSLMALAQESAVEKPLEKNAVSDNVIVQQALAQQALSQKAIVPQGEVDKDIVKQESTLPAVVLHEQPRKTPEVGKHVMANMDAGSMILSLLMVLALIVLCAFVLKRFNLTQQGVSQLKVVTSLSLGAKERVVVVQAGEQQLLLGVTAQQVTLIERLSEPLPSQKANTVELPKGVLSFLLAKKS
jgi:flagellar protein FliO/FliZ